MVHDEVAWRRQRKSTFSESRFMRISSHLTKTEDSGVEQEEQRVKLLDRWPRAKGQEEGHLEGAERRRERGGRGMERGAVVPFLPYQQDPWHLFGEK